MQTSDDACWASEICAVDTVAICDSVGRSRDQSALVVVPCNWDAGELAVVVEAGAEEENSMGRMGRHSLDKAVEEVDNQHIGISVTNA